MAKRKDDGRLLMAAKGEMGRTSPDLQQYAVASSMLSSSRQLKALGEDIEISSLVDLLQQDWLVRQALRFSSNIILSMIAEYEHEDERIRDFVRNAIRYMDRSWRSAQLAILEGMWYGYSVSEIMWEPEPPTANLGGAWLIDHLKPLNPADFWPSGLDTSKGLTQEEVTWKKGQIGEKKIPGDKIVHWAFESAADPYGTPLARNVWMLAKGRGLAYQWWLTGLERLGQPMIVEIVPKGGSRNEQTGDTKSYREMAEESWNQSQGGTVIIRVANDDEGKLPKIEALKFDGWTEEFKDYFAYTDRGVFMGFGVPPLLVMEPEHASRAQSTVQSDLVQITSAPVAEEFARSVLIDQVVRRLIVYNFGEQDDYGEFPVASAIDQETLVSMLEGLGRLGAFGVMPMTFYRRIQEQFPEILPTVEEVEASGDLGLGLPAGVSVG